MNNGSGSEREKNRKKENEKQKGKQQQQKTRRTTERASSVRVLRWQGSREISSLFF